MPSICIHVRGFIIRFPNKKKTPLTLVPFNCSAYYEHTRL